MNQEIQSDQTSQLNLKEQSKVQSPFKPKIPYSFENTFVQDFGQASYLSLQPSDKLKNNKPQINNNDKQCCEKFEQILEYYESTLQSQIFTMFQLNELIDSHSYLLETYMEKQKSHIDQQKQPFVQPEQQQQQSQSLLWKQKWEQENKLNQKKDQKINELKKKIEDIQETLVQTDSYTITLELESWKSKYQNLTKIHKETAQKLKGLENELEQLNQNTKVDESLQQTSVTQTRRRLTKKLEI